MEEDKLFEMVDSALNELIQTGLLNLKVDDNSFEATQLGQAIVASAFSPEDGIFIYEELKRALKAFVMDGEMHIFYLFTPLQSGTTVDIDWPRFRDEINSLDESGLRALQFMGVSPGLVNSMYFCLVSLSYQGSMFACGYLSNSSILTGPKEETPSGIPQSYVYTNVHTQPSN